MKSYDEVSEELLNRKEVQDLAHQLDTVTEMLKNLCKKDMKNLAIEGFALVIGSLKKGGRWDSLQDDDGEDTLSDEIEHHEDDIWDEFVSSGSVFLLVLNRYQDILGLGQWGSGNYGHHGDKDGMEDFYHLILDERDQIAKTYHKLFAD